MTPPTSIRQDDVSNTGTWQFWIDVGGTFTDAIAVAPSGKISIFKVLSSSVVKGMAQRGSGPGRILDPAFAKYPDHFFDGYRVRLIPPAGHPEREFAIDRFMSEGGTIEFSGSSDHAPRPGDRFEIESGEPAPLLAIRMALGIGLDQPIGPAHVRLGTTRATNALLERQGARTAFVTTQGFGDVLRIANQDRPSIFQLRIQKPEALYESVVELPERIGAGGEVLAPLDAESVRSALAPLKQAGIQAVAICLMNAYKNPEHEKLVAAEAIALGFAQISVSSEVSPTIKIVSRGDTTVVDAYLTPVIEGYVESIRKMLPEGNLQLMTSAGALVPAGALAGKDTIFSGPAGGVVGFSGVAEAAGWRKAIGFDMGGTSTDVSRFDGRFVYEYETQKAGVRIVAPMLAIETVAAGGGSICGFDGQKLTVGPRSAGADPGPACYGRGGPLTVTDVNLFLGRLHSDFFPFKLDREAVLARLDEVGEEVAKGGKRTLDPIEMAEGFIRIANANMAASIKKISISRGYNLGEYGLVCFGGAGGQHACAIARELGIDSVLIHPYAGVLSAYGLGLADVTKFAVRTILAPLDEARLDEIDQRCAQMTRELRDRILAEGSPAESLQPPVRELDLRYQGQSSAITVAGGGSGGGERDYAEEFERLHRQLYGHAFSGRAIEVVAARVQLTAVMSKPETRIEKSRPARPSPNQMTRAIFGGEQLETAVHLREELHPGAAIEGPAIVIEPTGTTVLDPGWHCAVTERGDLMLTDRSGAAKGERLSSEANPVLLEIFHNHYASIAEQMGVTLQRTSLSVNVKERLDFSCAVFTADGDLVANAPHMPVHLGAMSECVKCVIEDVPDLRAGDVILTNDPMRGGSHLPDITVVTPVFDDLGRRILFFTASRAHHAEIGGKRPGSMPPDSTNLAEEGVLIRRFKIVEEGQAQLGRLGEALRGAPYPSRAPEENLADVSAQIAANQSGVANLIEMVDHYGLETVQAYMGHIQRAAENKMRAALAGLADRIYEFEDAMDDGSKIRVAITIAGDEARVDFTGTSPPTRNNLNANPAIVKAAVIYCFRCLIDEDIPLNSGVLAPVRIVLPECFLNPPVHEDPARCVAVAGGNVETSQRIVDVILGALGLAAASQGTMNNLTFGNDTFGYYETICGGAGAGPDFDGADAVHTHMTNTRLTDPEVLEAQYPVRLGLFEIRRGSGGAGRRTGGAGTRREIEFLEPLDVSILSNRRKTRPFGLEGGEPGAAGRNLLRKAGDPDDKWSELPHVATFRAGPGDRLRLETPGGGGYGKAVED